MAHNYGRSYNFAERSDMLEGSQAHDGVLAMINHLRYHNASLLLLEPVIRKLERPAVLSHSAHVAENLRSDFALGQAIELALHERREALS